MKVETRPGCYVLKPFEIAYLHLLLVIADQFGSCDTDLSTMLRLLDMNKFIMSPHCIYE